MRKKKNTSLPNEKIPRFLCSLLEGINLLVSAGTASAIAMDRLCMVKRKTARSDDTKVSTYYYQFSA